MSVKKAVEQFNHLAQSNANLRQLLESRDKQLAHYKLIIRQYQQELGLVTPSNNLSFAIKPQYIWEKP